MLLASLHNKVVVSIYCSHYFGILNCISHILGCTKTMVLLVIYTGFVVPIYWGRYSDIIKKVGSLSLCTRGLYYDNQNWGSYSYMLG